MKVKELIKQLTENADPEGIVHHDSSVEGTFEVTNIMVSAFCDEGSTVGAGDIILCSFDIVKE